MGKRYVVIGSGVGESEGNGIGRPEEGTIEARLMGAGGFVPTFRGKGEFGEAVKGLAVRSRSRRNPTYFPLTPRSFTDFDWLVMVDATGYSRGGRALP
jgi:hypothetical protein